jgi:hypothetical protein
LRSPGGMLASTKGSSSSAKGEQRMSVLMLALRLACSSSTLRLLLGCCWALQYAWTRAVRAPAVSRGPAASSLCCASCSRAQAATPAVHRQKGWQAEVLAGYDGKRLQCTIGSYGKQKFWQVTMAKGSKQGHDGLLNNTATPAFERVKHTDSQRPLHTVSLSWPRKDHCPLCVCVC